MGVQECQSLDHTGIKENLQEYFHRVRKVLKNKHSDIRDGIPVIQYTFGIIHLRIDELRALDTKTRKHTHYVYHTTPKIIYEWRELGSRGLRRIVFSWKIETSCLTKYVVGNSPHYETAQEQALRTIYLEKKIRVLGQTNNVTMEEGY